MTTPDFYRAFEERYRGPRSLIQQRLQVYLPYVQPLLPLEPTAPAAAAIDLGCGRGEWLELLQTAGFAPQGVDLDEGMLAACHELGLPAVQGDALAHLRALGDATQAIVSGFHIAEHLSFDDLQMLIREALRVLQPGGLLILETPNPENITVGSCSFYLDPTHHRPLPPKLLSFLPEHLGYARVKVLRLQEDRRLVDSPSIQLIDVLTGVSPDYAVVAQKFARTEILQTFDAAFALVHGLELDALAQRFDSRVPPPHMQEELIARLEAHIHAQLTPLMHQVTRTEARINTQLIPLIDQVTATLDAVLQSRSWRITAPLRWLGLQALRLQHTDVAAVAKNTIGTLAQRSMQIVRNRPGLHRNCIAMARKLGVLHALEALYLRLSSASSAAASGQVDLSKSHSHDDSSPLSGRAQSIYLELKAELAACQRKGDQ